jgi:hypothetical protein
MPRLAHRRASAAPAGGWEWAAALARMRSLLRQLWREQSRATRSAENSFLAGHVPEPGDFLIDH